MTLPSRFSAWCAQRTLIWLLIWLPKMVRNSEKCCVPNCGKTREDNVVLHKFPDPVNEPDRFRLWMYAIGGDVLALDNQYIYRYRKVCHIHFEQKYTTRSDRLSAIAIPTLHLKGVPDPRGQLTARYDNIVAASTAQPTTSKGIEKGLRIPLMDMTQQYVNIVADDSPQPTTSKDFHGQPRNLHSKTPAKVDKSPQEVNLDFHGQPRNLHSKKSAKVDKSSQKVTHDFKPGYTTRFCTEASTLAKHVKRLTQAKDNYAIRLKKAMSLSTNKTFQNALGKFTTTALLFIMMQFREITKKKMGRRFTKKEKIMALSLYKQGPKAYRWLSRVFVLPSPLTLSRMISAASLRTGINENIFENLKKKAMKMSSTDKMCILMFDEMAIAPHFQYNTKKDLIIGFEDSGKKRTKKIADHALVFMIRGITRNYKQPISYSFCCGSTGKEELARVIKDHIRKLKSSGFKVIATICDQGSSNMSAINYLISETKANYLRQNLNFNHNTFEVDGQQVIPLYDPPHLIKGVRNNLITKNLTCTIDNEVKTGMWEHIIKLYNENPAYKGIRLLPKLTEQHVNPKKMQKMKVKFATQLLSRSVAVNMGYLADKGILDPASKETADIILFFDELFDSVNGGFANEKKRPGKELLGPLTPQSPHQRVWTRSKRILKTMKFVTAEGNISHVPSITNWFRTLENFELLKEFLFQNDVKSIWLRHFNQDPIENFFGCIRSHGVRSTNPTCANFEVAFAALLINNLNSVHSPGSNCERDQGYAFKSLSKIFFNPITNCAPVDSLNDINFDHIGDNVLVGVRNKTSDAKIMAEIEYVTGYILRKSMPVFKQCEKCKACLYDKDKKSKYIKLKEYHKGKTYMSYPADKLVECFSNIQDVVTYILKTDSDMPNIKNYMKTMLGVVLNFNFLKCLEHKDVLIGHIMELSCRFFLHNWCKDTNKILRGSRLDFDREDRLQEMAHKYFLKRKK